MPSSRTLDFNTHVNQKKEKMQQNKTISKSP